MPPNKFLLGVSCWRGLLDDPLVRRVDFVFEWGWSIFEEPYVTIGRLRGGGRSIFAHSDPRQTRPHVIKVHGRKLKEGTNGSTEDQQLDLIEVTAGDEDMPEHKTKVPNGEG